MFFDDSAYRHPADAEGFGGFALTVIRQIIHHDKRVALVALGSGKPNHLTTHGATLHRDVFVCASFVMVTALLSRSRVKAAVKSAVMVSASWWGKCIWERVNRSR